MIKNDEIAYKVNLLSERVREYKKKNIFLLDGIKNRSADLSYRQMEIMFVIEFLDLHNISKMTELMGLSKSTLSILVNKLVNKKYVVKSKPEGNEDRRKVNFDLTDLGRKIVYDIQKENMDKFTYLYTTFSDYSKECFAKGTECLRRISDNENAIIAGIINRMLITENAEPAMVKVAKDLSFFIFTMAYNIEGPKSMKNKGEFEVTLNQFILMERILSLDINTISKLEKHTGSSASTISITISKLVDNGYVRKEKFEDDTDGRSVRLVVTQKGKDIIEKMTEQQMQKIFDYINNLDPDKKVTFVEAIDYLLKAFS